MKPFAMLSSLGLTALLATGCHHSHVQTADVEAAGVHVVTAGGTTTIVRSDGKTTRVCSLDGSDGPGHPGRGPKPGRGGKRRAPGGAPPSADHGVGSLFFSLCEARGNGDISAEQYTKIVDMMLAHVSARSGRGGCHGHDCPHHPHDMRGPGGPPGDAADAPSDATLPPGPPGPPPHGGPGRGPGAGGAQKP